MKNVLSSIFAKRAKPLILLILTMCFTVMIYRCTNNKYFESSDAVYTNDDLYDKTARENATQEFAKDTVEIVELDKEWTAIGQFSEGLCPVQDKANNLWGYVDIEGEYIIAPAFHAALPFSEGLAAIKDESGFYRFIDKTGKVKITGNIVSVERRFRDELPGFRDRLALVLFDNSIYALINPQAEIAKTFDVGFVWSVNPDYKYYGDMIVSGTTFYDTQYNETDTKIHADLSYAYKNIDWINRLVKVEKISNGIYTEAIYDFDGNIILDYKYSRVLPLSREAFLVTDDNGISAIIDTQGNELVPFAYDAKFDVQSDSHPNVNAIPFVVRDGEETGKPKYFDVAAKQVRAGFLLPNETNAYKYVFYTKVGEIYRVRKLYSEEIYYNSGGNIEVYSLSTGKFAFIYNFGLFLAEGVIPVSNADGYTFAVMQKENK